MCEVMALCTVNSVWLRSLCQLGDISVFEWGLMTFELLDVNIFSTFQALAGKTI